LLQVLVLSFFIFGFSYSVPLTLDTGIIYERLVIIQFLGNYILIETVLNAIFLYGVWTLVAFIPILLLKDSRKALGANLKLMFFPNFFFYLFLSRYSPHSFSSIWLNLLVPFLLFAIWIIALSVLVPKIFQKLKTPKKDAQLQELRNIAEENRAECPKCGAKFESTPLFCYKCSTRLIKEENQNHEEQF
jgi:hypothetical protein